MYPSLSVLLEGKVPLMMCFTWHLQASLTASVVGLLPTLGAPLVHNHFLALGIVGAPPWRNLQIIKYMTFKKTK